MNNTEVEYFPIWRRYRHQIEAAELTDTELATLVRTMMDYQFEGIEPVGLTGKVQVFWAIFRDDLDYARQRYETSVQNGKKGGRKKKPKETQVNPEEGKSITESESESISESITETESIPESLPESVSTTDTDPDPVSSAEAEVSLLKKAYGEFGWVQLSDMEYSALQQEMGEAQLRRCIAYIDESAQITGNRNCWRDWRMVLRRCYQKRWHEADRVLGKQTPPQGASGVLGEAELEAIRRVLAT